MSALQQVMFGMTATSSWAGNLSTASYASKSFSLASQVAVLLGALAISNDGTKMYSASGGGAVVYQYTLSSAYDASTGSYASVSYNASAQVGSIRGVFFSSDGTKMYLSSSLNSKIFQYTLGTPWVVSSASYASKSLDFSAQAGDMRSFFIGLGGTRLYSVSNAGAVYQYNLSVAWDISTASFSTSKDVTGQTSDANGIFFSPDDSKMYVTLTAVAQVFQYSVGTPGTISTASYASKLKDVTAQETSLTALTFNNDGTKMYVAGDTNRTVYQYTVGS